MTRGTSQLLGIGNNGNFGGERNKSVQRDRSLPNDIGSIDFQAFSLRPFRFSFSSFDPYPSEETILLLFRPRDLGYFVTPDRVDASVSLPFSRPSNRRIARSRYSTSFSTNVTRNAISYHRHHRHIPDNYSLSSISIFHILRVNTETVSIIYRTL